MCLPERGPVSKKGPDLYTDHCREHIPDSHYHTARDHLHVRTLEGRKGAQTPMHDGKGAHTAVRINLPLGGKSVLSPKKEESGLGWQQRVKCTQDRPFLAAGLENPFSLFSALVWPPFF